MSFRSSIQQHPLAAYFLPTFAWSWGWWTLYYIPMPGGMPGGIADISPITDGLTDRNRQGSEVFS